MILANSGAIPRPRHLSLLAGLMRTLVCSRNSYSSSDLFAPYVNVLLHVRRKGRKKKSINKKSAAIFGKEFSSWCMCLCACVNNCLLHFCQLILSLKQIPKGFFYFIFISFLFFMAWLSFSVSLKDSLWGQALQAPPQVHVGPTVVPELQLMLKAKSGSWSTLIKAWKGITPYSLPSKYLYLLIADTASPTTVLRVCTQDWFLAAGNCSLHHTPCPSASSAAQHCHCLREGSFHNE